MTVQPASASIPEVAGGSKKMDGGMTFREEKDALGSVRVPADRLWGAQTQRCLENFKIGDMHAERMPLEVYRALAVVKYASAKVNMTNKRLSPDMGEAIMQAAKEAYEGKLDEHFPLLIWQTGSGTQSNMNANETIANRAAQILGWEVGKKKVHPNDHVNLGQSSNDSFPTAMHIATVIALHSLLSSAELLIASFHELQERYKDTPKIGRTHLMDAVPLAVGDEVSAWKQMIIHSVRSIHSILSLKDGSPAALAQGGTAVGSGLNSFPDFDKQFAAEVNAFIGEPLKAVTGQPPFAPAANKFQALSNHDEMLRVSGELNTLATSLMKIANDTRLLASGPRAGLAEWNLPANEPGSSIMPGKVNPTQAECMTMIAAQVMGNHTACTIGNSHGHLQLNVFNPLIAANVLRSIRLLSDGMVSFKENCVAGMVLNQQAVDKHLDSSLMLVTCLTPVIGYDKAAEATLTAHHENLTLREVVVDRMRLMSLEEFNSHVDPKKMLRL